VNDGYAPNTQNYDQVGVSANSHEAAAVDVIGNTTEGLCVLSLEDTDHNDSTTAGIDRRREGSSIRPG
jgi:hypothetical protein